MLRVSYLPTYSWFICKARVWCNNHCNKSVWVNAVSGRGSHPSDHQSSFIHELVANVRSGTAESLVWTSLSRLHRALKLSQIFTLRLSFSTNVLGLCDSYKTLMWTMKALCEYCSLTETRRVHDDLSTGDSDVLWLHPVETDAWWQSDRLFVSKVLNYDSEPNILLYLNKWWGLDELYQVNVESICWNAPFSQ